MTAQPVDGASLLDLRHGDCVAIMGQMPDASVVAIVCDPPYELSFMGRSWDGSGVAFQVATWAEALRVLKPGGHLLAFGGTRTYHRMVVAIEDAGFEIRDSIHWIYGSGFPKSLNVGKAIDKAAGAERTEVIGVKPGHEDFVDRTDAHSAGGRSDGWERPWRDDPNAVAASHMTLAPATPEAAEWEGWGTALKPSHEPIVVARKPLVGTVAANVLAHGTGAIHIDATRTHTASSAAQAYTVKRLKPGTTLNSTGGNWRPDDGVEYQGETKAGRWPSNVILTHSPGCEAIGKRKVATSDPRRSDGSVNGSRGAHGIFSPMSEGYKSPTFYADDDGTETIESYACVAGCPVAEIDSQSGDCRSSGLYDKGSRVQGAKAGAASILIDGFSSSAYDDNGGASRFFPTFMPDDPPFLYCAKASRSERGATNNHPTVKPVALMRWLVRLVAKPGAVVLDPFLGSGTTGVAALAEGCEFIGIDQDAEYIEIARTRMRGQTYAPGLW